MVLGFWNNLFASDLIKKPLLHGEQDEDVGCLLVIRKGGLHTRGEVFEIYSSCPPLIPSTTLALVEVKTTFPQDEEFSFPLTFVENWSTGEFPEVSSFSCAWERREGGDVLKQFFLIEYFFHFFCTVECGFP